MEQILVAVISGLCVAIPSIIATVSSNKQNNKLIIYRIDELDTKVQKYNNLKDRMFEAEKKIALLENSVKSKKSVE